MSTLQNRIGVIATQLQQEGKSPSLALVRARLGGGINPAELFSAYQSWRAQGSPLTKSSAEADTAGKSPADVKDDENDTVIKQDLARIEAKLDLILTLLQERS
jgi:hypothetical protein